MERAEIGERILRKELEGSEMRWTRNRSVKDIAHKIGAIPNKGTKDKR